VGRAVVISMDRNPEKSVFSAFSLNLPGQGALILMRKSLDDLCESFDIDIDSPQKHLRSPPKMETLTFPGRSTLGKASGPLWKMTSSSFQVTQSAVMCCGTSIVVKDVNAKARVMSVTITKKEMKNPITFNNLCKRFGEVRPEK